MPKISDFGLAKIFQDGDVVSSDATRTGETIGTPRYMAPEQAAGEPQNAGPAADIYALGNILYECLTGRAPFVSASVADTLKKIREDEPISLRRLQPSIPIDLETICLHCLKKDPNHRYSSAACLAADLRRFLEQRPILARPTPWRERVWKWCRRRPTQATVIVIGVFAVLFGATAAIARQRVENQRIASSRAEIADLMNEARESLEREELDIAHARFLAAWMKVRAEPALGDYETSIAGWLDHTRKAANRYQWKQRIPPRDFDHRRDEALLASLLILPYLEHPTHLARESIREALELTLPNDSAWELEREQLMLLDVDLVEFDSGPSEALRQLDATVEFPSRRFHERREQLLQKLDQSDEAEKERRQASNYAPRIAATQFHAGVDRLRNRQFKLAIDAFDAVLMAEPEHFPARLFEAICFLNLSRPGEAKVALTACIAQRPRFQWNYYFRGLTNIAMGDSTTAVRDFDRAIDGRCSEIQMFLVLIELGKVCLSHGFGDEALEAFVKTTDVMPGEPSGWRFWAWVESANTLPPDDSGESDLRIGYTKDGLR